MSSMLNSDQQAQLDTITTYLNTELAKNFPGTTLSFQNVEEHRDHDDLTAILRFETPQVQAAIKKAETELDAKLDAVKNATGERDITVWSYPVSEEHDQISAAASTLKWEAHEQAGEFVSQVGITLARAIGVADASKELYTKEFYIGTLGNANTSNDEPYAEARITFDPQTLEAAATKCAAQHQKNKVYDLIAQIAEQYGINTKNLTSDPNPSSDILDHHGLQTPRDYKIMGELRIIQNDRTGSIEILPNYFAESRAQDVNMFLTDLQTAFENSAMAGIEIKEDDIFETPFVSCKYSGADNINSLRHNLINQLGNNLAVVKEMNSGNHKISELLKVLNDPATRKDRSIIMSKLSDVGIFADRDIGDELPEHFHLQLAQALTEAGFKSNQHANGDLDAEDIDASPKLFSQYVAGQIISSIENGDRSYWQVMTESSGRKFTNLFEKPTAEAGKPEGQQKDLKTILTEVAMNNLNIPVPATRNETAMRLAAGNALIQIADMFEGRTTKLTVDEIYDCLGTIDKNGFTTKEWGTIVAELTRTLTLVNQKLPHKQKPGVEAGNPEGLQVGAAHAVVAARGT